MKSSSARACAPQWRRRRRRCFSNNNSDDKIQRRLSTAEFRFFFVLSLLYRSSWCSAWRPFARRSTTHWFWTKTSTWKTTCWPTTNCASKCRSRRVGFSWQLYNLSLGSNRFCSRLGTLFGFVVNDLQDKIGHLNALVADDEEHFSTVQNMIIYETSNNILRKGTSGSITLLRLHRGLGNGVPIQMFFLRYLHHYHVNIHINFRVHYSVHV